MLGVSTSISNMEAWKEIALSLPRVRCKSDIATLMPSRALALACLACFWEFNMRNFEETMDDSVSVSRTINAIAPIARTRAKAERFVVLALFCIILDEVRFGTLNNSRCVSKINSKCSLKLCIFRLYCN